MSNLNLSQKILFSIVGICGATALFGSVYSLGELNATRAINRSSTHSLSLVQPKTSKEISLTEDLFRDWAKLAKQTAKTYAEISTSSSTNRYDTRANLLFLLRESNNMIQKLESSNFDRFDKNTIKGDYLEVNGYIEGFLGIAK